MIIYNLQEFCQLLKINRPILSIDYGEKKIGVAISSCNHLVAFPLQVISGLDMTSKISDIRHLVKLHLAEAVVIGLPLQMSGEKGAQAQLVQNFAESLNEAINLPIYLQDERLTSRAADNLLKDAGFNRKRRNQMDDAIAATMILETTLSSIALIRRSTE